MAGLERFSLVAHDWGAVGLTLPPERIERLVVMNAVPFLPGYEWHKVARWWRTPLVGELAMGFTFKWNFRKGVPDALVDRAWENFDHGTQRAILKLYRSAPPERLAGASERLRAITAPALVLWGEPDPYLPAELAHRYGGALGGEARVEVVEGAGHWPWVGRPEVADTVARFVTT
jgi:pimeloyl-ACP methyl ester carboxylesterase